MAQQNYGGMPPSTSQLMGLALGKLLKFGGTNYMNARQIKNQVNVQNQGLPEGYKINYDPGYFYAGDPTAMGTAIKDLSKNRMDQYTSDYISEQSGLPVGPLGAVEKMYTGEIAPVRVEDGKNKIKGKYGKQALESLPYVRKYIESLSGTQIPDAPASGVTTDVNGNPVLNASTAQYQAPEIPDDIYITPEMIGQVTDDVRADREFVEIKKPKFDIEKKRTELQVKKLGKEIEKLQQILKYSPRLFEERIAAYKRSGRGGRAITELEYLIKQGVPSSEIVKWVQTKRNSGVDLLGLLGAGDLGGGSGTPSFEDWDAEQDDE